MAIALSQKRSKSNQKRHVYEETMSATSSDVSYNANAATGYNGGSLRRIRTPAPHDVLSGRGGNVNAHPGNCQFRDWVYVRKEDYNLAHSKQDKADICREVISRVEALGGRFLTKESPNSQWWVELDDERIMAKTSQALREGAPKIREAHRDELGTVSNNNNNHNGTSTRKSRSSRPAALKRALELTSQQQQQQSFGIPNASQQQEQRSPLSGTSDGKRVRLVDYNGQLVLPNQETPPLRSIPPPPPSFRSASSDLQLGPTPEQLPPMFPPPPLRRRLSATAFYDSNINSNLTRSHSLASSDVSPEEVIPSDDFVNPFEDESNLLQLNHTSMPNHQLLTNNPLTATTAAAPPSRNSSLGLAPMPPRLGVWRDTTTSSTGSTGSSDLAGLGALFRSSDSFNKLPSPLNVSTYFKSETSGGILRRSSGSSSTNNHNNESTRYAARTEDSDDDCSSVTSENTLGLPVWEWFNREETAAANSTATTAHQIPVSPQ